MRAWQGESGGLDARIATDPALRSAVLGLAALDLARQDYASALSEIARLATRAVPHADVACVVADPPAAGAPGTTALADELELISQRLHEGPHVSAQAQHCPVCSGSLGGEQRWPRFGPRAGRLGVHSALSVPLVRDGVVLATLDVFSRDKAAFDPAAIEAAQCYAAFATVSLGNAGSLDAANGRVAQLEQAIAGRAVIERAIGILISRSGGSAEEAFERLRSMSRREHRKVAALADSLVTASANRARARRPER